jgi:hypothetical protein
MAKNKKAVKYLPSKCNALHSRRRRRKKKGEGGGKKRRRRRKCSKFKNFYFWQYHRLNSRPQVRQAGTLTRKPHL